jgi:hypothetical protein
VALECRGHAFPEIETNEKTGSEDCARECPKAQNSFRESSGKRWNSPASRIRSGKIHSGVQVRRHIESSFGPNHPDDHSGAEGRDSQRDPGFLAKNAGAGPALEGYLRCDHLPSDVAEIDDRCDFRADGS